MPNKKTDKQNSVHPFDQMMFGPRTNQSTTLKSDNNNEESKDDQSFDIFKTAQTMTETYKQLSPYVKGISKMIKKFKS